PGFRQRGPARDLRPFVQGRRPVEGRPLQAVSTYLACFVGGGHGNGHDLSNRARIVVAATDVDRSWCIHGDLSHLNRERLPQGSVLPKGGPSPLLRVRS